jgi:hypothetical protein
LPITRAFFLELSLAHRATTHNRDDRVRAPTDPCGRQSAADRRRARSRGVDARTSQARSEDEDERRRPRIGGARSTREIRDSFGSCSVPATRMCKLVESGQGDLPARRRLTCPPSCANTARPDAGHCAHLGDPDGGRDVRLHPRPAGHQDGGQCSCLRIRLHAANHPAPRIPTRDRRILRWRPGERWSRS